VAEITETISTRRSNLDRQRAWHLAWAHDLNRWPFAHNVEDDSFDQGVELRAYLNKLGWPDADAMQASGIAAKNLAILDGEARAVLLADMVTGFFEDLLLLIVGLNITPDVIPRAIFEILTMDLTDGLLRERLIRIAHLLHTVRDIRGFMIEFDSLLNAQTQRFLEAHGWLSEDPLDRPEFMQVHHDIRQTFLPQYVFPINNEKVSHGNVLRTKIMPQLIKGLRLDGEDPHVVLPRWTEREAVDYGLRSGYIEPAVLMEVIPDIDFVTKNEPERSFIDVTHHSITRESETSRSSRIS
jgi:hypothetical protein